MPDDSPNLTLGEISRVLRATDPAALLVSPRILRRVIQADGQAPGLGLHVPHQSCYVVARDRLLRLADAAELGLEDNGRLPDQVILLCNPSPVQLAAETPGDILLRCWRLLFHGRVHLAVRRQRQEGKLDAAAITARLQTIGAAQVEEIGAVLRQEQWLLPPADDATLYKEFAALYLELRYFARPLIAYFFPSIADWNAIDGLLAADVAADEMWAATRPAGASEPEFQRIAAALDAELPGDEEPEPVPPANGGALSRGHQQRLLERADQAAARGNHVRAAIIRTRAAQGAGPASAALAQAGARDDLRRLGSRLQRALELSAAQAKLLRRLLPVLLEPAAAGIWPGAARLLYDLQKVCVDHERAVFEIDLLGWAVSLGRRPLKRPLPGQASVRALKHLRGTLRRLAAVPIPHADRRRVADILEAAIARTEARVRDYLRPLLLQTLAEVGLQPQNLPESVARHKLIEELLDRVAERGFVTIGDLRDALSRNQLKLPDLTGPVELLHGDPLLRTNRGLARRLDGIYQGGEIYMRWLQRLSALAFGNPVGRFVTRYFTLPFGSAFILLAGAEALVHEGSKLLGSEVPPPPPPPDSDDTWTPPPSEPVHVQLLNWYSFAMLGLFLLLLIHVPAFRNVVWRGLCAVGRWSHRLLIELPTALMTLPAVQAFLASRAWQACKQFVVKPALLTAPLVALLALLRAGPVVIAAAGGAAFVTALALVNTRLGRDLEEITADRSARLWDHISADFLPGLFHLVISIFKRLVEGMERVIYTVDELLRFRAGDSAWSLAVKAVLGVGWGLVTYIVRIFINLFVEPTFNPIKHFPVVTVAAKMLVPVIPLILGVFKDEVSPLLGVPLASALAWLIITFLPGLAGFLVWEFKENWRLYRANRPAVLRPVVVGHHGETVRRLLRPGIHSGTVPKLYAKLRKAARTGQRTGSWKAFLRQREALHHVAEAVQRFVEREFCRPLAELAAEKVSGTVSAAESSRCEGRVAETVPDTFSAAVGAVQLATNSIRLRLGDGEHVVALVITAHADCLLGHLELSGSLADLPTHQRTALAMALAGLYRLSGIDLVHDVRLEPIGWPQWVDTWERLKEGKEVVPRWTEVTLPATAPLGAAAALSPG
jgi:hypothetical protein